MQRKEFERVASFINSYLRNRMQVRLDAVQSLKAESTLSQEAQKDVPGHSTVGAEICSFRVGCPRFQ